MLAHRPRLLVISAVLPFPGQSGQQQRVLNKIIAFRETFHTTFLTFSEAANRQSVQSRLLDFCDDAVVLPSLYSRTQLHRAARKVSATAFSLTSGLKTSNYIVGHLELTAERIERALENRYFDVAVFEYWHAHDSTRALQKKSIRTVLDMHDILWRSYERQLDQLPLLPPSYRRRRIRSYQRKEERAWRDFDALISINREEDIYVRGVLAGDRPVFYAPMGIDLAQWPLGYKPVSPPRIAFFGGLGSPHNQHEARHFLHRAMPRVWESEPRAEYWIVGSNPPPEIRDLAASEPRVRVTGFVEDVVPLLQSMTLVVCPWKGTYGFRSRLVQVMALGLPVVTSPDAIWGMDFQHGKGILLADDGESFAKQAVELLRNTDLAQSQGILGRQAVEDKYSFEATYGQLTREILSWLAQPSSQGESATRPGE